MHDTQNQTEHYLSDDSPDIVSRLLEKTGGNSGVRLLAILFMLPAVYFLFTLDGFLIDLIGVPFALYSAVTMIFLLSGKKAGWMLCMGAIVLMGFFSILAIPLMGGVPALLLFSLCTAMLVQATRRSIKAVFGISPLNTTVTCLSAVFLALTILAVAFIVMAEVIG